MILWVVQHGRHKSRPILEFAPPSVINDLPVARHTIQARQRSSEPLSSNAVYVVLIWVLVTDSGSA